MTYLDFHFVFIIPPILFLAAFFLRTREKWPGRKGSYSLAAIVIIALVYTTAWDNYLVYRGVWGYGPDRVLGTIGYVPVEEYLFFLLQPILAGLWFFALLSRLRIAPASRGTARWFGALIYLAISLAGIVLLQYEKGLYMGLILVWAGPVLMGQWAYAGSWIWRVRRIFIVGVVAPTFYLWIADRIAIGLGIWYIEGRYTLGFDPLGLPVEEALFFLATNLLVVQGLILFMHIGDEQGKR